MSFGKFFHLVTVDLSTFVSILVLMDVVREGGVTTYADTQQVSFNPCSNGCRSGRLLTIKEAVRGFPFQSLF